MWVWMGSWTPKKRGLTKKTLRIMLKEDMKIVDPIGLHARPAGQLADIAGKFNCAISFIFRDRAVNAKSIINLMSLGIVKDSQVSIVCDGVDEIDAMGAIKRFMAESKLI